MKDLKEKACEAFEHLASNLVSNAGSVFVWGEVNVPDCLRKEVEKQEET